MKNCVKNTWQNYGDVNFFDCGGVMVKKDEPCDRRRSTVCILRNHM